MNKNIKYCGFSLIEVMVVIAVFSIIIASVFSIMTIGRNAWYQGGTAIDVQQEGRKAMDKMVRELRESGSQKQNLPTSSPYQANEVIFQISVGVDTDGNIIWGATTDWADSTTVTASYAIKYYLSNNKIYRSVLNSYPSGSVVGTDTIMANNIQSLTFTGNVSPATTINITVVAEKTVLQGGASQRNLQFTLTSKATLRN